MLEFYNHVWEKGEWRVAKLFKVVGKDVLVILEGKLKSFSPKDVIDLGHVCIQCNSRPSGPTLVTKSELVMCGNCYAGLSGKTVNDLFDGPVFRDPEVGQVNMAYVPKITLKYIWEYCDSYPEGIHKAYYDHVGKQARAMFYSHPFPLDTKVDLEELKEVSEESASD